MKKPNIVLIVIDSLRADVINEINTPKITQLLNKSTYSLNGITNGMPTYYSFPSILGGIYPFDEGKKKLPIPSYLVSKSFKHLGYTTIGLTANLFTSSYTRYNRWFDIFEDFKPSCSNKSSKLSFLRKIKNLIRRLLGDNIWYILGNYKSTVIRFYKILMNNFRPFPDSKILFDRALKYIRTLNNNFFLWIHIMDTHFPYHTIQNQLSFFDIIIKGFLYVKVLRIIENADNFMRNIEGKDFERVIRNIPLQLERIRNNAGFLKKVYIKSVQNLDSLLSEFINTIKSICPNTIFFITSDHGEEFFEYFTYFHYPIAHNDFLLKVPIILYGDSIPQKELKTISNVDIVPTMADIVGFDKKSFWRGESILSIHNCERVHICESLFGYVPSLKDTGVVDKEHKVLISAISDQYTQTILEDYNQSLIGSYPNMGSHSDFLKEELLMINKKTELLAKLKK